ncbi:MAG: hypothetical protein ACF8CQ_19680, partial [Rhodopirellula sp. JB044]
LLTLRDAGYRFVLKPECEDALESDAAGANAPDTPTVVAPASPNDDAASDGEPAAKISSDKLKSPENESSGNEPSTSSDEERT